MFRNLIFAGDRMRLSRIALVFVAFPVSLVGWQPPSNPMTAVMKQRTMAFQQPSFAGRWALAPDSARSGRGAVTGNPGSGWGTPLTITEGDTRLTVSYPFFSRYDMQPPLKFTYALDGSETRNTVMVGEGVLEQFSHAAWNGASLVITTIHVVANPAGAGDSLRVEVTQRLSLESPARLIVETTRAGVLGGLPTTTRTVYTKQ